MLRIEFTKAGGPGWLVAGMFVGWPFMETLWIRGRVVGPAWTIVGAVTFAFAAYWLLFRPVNEAMAGDGPFLGSPGLERVLRGVLATALIALIAWTAITFHWAAEHWIRVARDARPLRDLLADWSWLLSFAWFNAVWFGGSRGREALERSTRLLGIASIAVACGLAWRIIPALERGRSIREWSWRDAPWDALAGPWAFLAVAALAAPLLLGRESAAQRRRALRIGGAVAVAATLALSLLTQQAFALTGHPKLEVEVLYGLWFRTRYEPVLVWQLLLLALTGLVVARLACYALLRLLPPGKRGRWSTSALVGVVCLPVLDLYYWGEGTLALKLALVVRFVIWTGVGLAGAAAATVWLQRLGRQARWLGIPVVASAAVLAAIPWRARAFPSQGELWLDFAPWATAVAVTMILSRRRT